MSEDVDEVVVEERHTVIEARNPFELLNFAILVAVFVIVILVVALSRPFIFGRIIPAVLGEDQPAAPLVDDLGQPIKEMPEEEETIGVDGTEPTEAETPAGAVTIDEETVAAEQPAGPEEPLAPAPPVTHVVQRGETLFAISRQYGVTVDAIVQANNITNPNRVNAGTVLTIPQP